MYTTKSKKKLYVNVTVFDFDRYTSDEQFDDNKHHMKMI